MGYRMTETHCRYCGKTFEGIATRVERGEVKYCSLACSGAARRRRVEMTCQNCGKTFIIKFHRLQDSDRGKFCSKKCYWANRPTGQP